MNQGNTSYYIFTYYFFFSPTHLLFYLQRSKKKHQTCVITPTTVFMSFIRAICAIIISITAPFRWHTVAIAAPEFLSGTVTWS